MQFDIGLLVLNLVENIHLLLISNDSLHYLGVVIASCSYLCLDILVWPEEVVEFESSRCFSPCLFCLVFA